MHLLNWNLNWASVNSFRGRELLKKITTIKPEVAVFTEVTTPFLDALGGHYVTAQADYGYNSHPNRRKVALWSKQAFFDIDDIGTSQLPTGRFIAANTETSLGNIRLLGVGISWYAAHVSTGQKNRKTWEDHRRYLAELKALILKQSNPMILAGDFNQRIPKQRQPNDIYEVLSAALSTLTLATSNLTCERGKATIDHIASTPGLTINGIRTHSNYKNDKLLTDHFGIACDVTHKTR
jgi:exonuclease III